jgi:hypothetical protein
MELLFNILFSLFFGVLGLVSLFNTIRENDALKRKKGIRNLGISILLILVSISQFIY